MGYHVTILRTRGKVSLPIAEDEIERAAATVPGGRYDRAERTLHADGGLQLWYRHGELWTKNPDDGTIEQMIALADARRTWIVRGIVVALLVILAGRRLVLAYW